MRWQLADLITSGVWKSANGGGDWTRLTSGWILRTLAIDPATPATLYVGTVTGVAKSTNGGGKWTAFNNGMTDTLVNTLAIDPKTPATLYAGTDDGGVFAIHQQMVQIYLPSILRH